MPAAKRLHEVLDTDSESCSELSPVHGRGLDMASDVSTNTATPTTMVGNQPRVLQSWSSALADYFNAAMDGMPSQCTAVDIMTPCAGTDSPMIGLKALLVLTAWSRSQHRLQDGRKSHQEGYGRGVSFGSRKSLRPACQSQSFKL